MVPTEKCVQKRIFQNITQGKVYLALFDRGLTETINIFAALSISTDYRQKSLPTSSRKVGSFHPRIKVYKRNSFETC